MVPIQVQDLRIYLVSAPILTEMSISVVILTPMTLFQPQVLGRKTGLQMQVWQEQQMHIWQNLILQAKDYGQLITEATELQKQPIL